MLAGFGLIAFRDPNGIRPVGLATRPSATTSTGTDYLVSSESVVADALGFSQWEDVKAGEAIIITRTSITRRQVAAPATFAPDIFEYVYFARPDSTIDGISVYRSRMAMGDMLAEEAKRVLQREGIEIDVVIPVSDQKGPPTLRHSPAAIAADESARYRFRTLPVLPLSRWLSISVFLTGKVSSRTDMSVALLSCLVRA